MYRIISLARLQVYCHSSRLRPLLFVLFHMCGQTLCNPYACALTHTHKMFRGMVSFQYRREAMNVNTVGRT